MERKNRMNDLGRRFTDGDDDAYTEVVQQYARRVYALCYRILRNEEDARDMVQEVFVRVYSKRGSFKGKASLYTWIYRIALNMCFSHLKRCKAKMVPFEDVESVLTVSQDDGEGRSTELRAMVAGALESLPPKQRAVFSMRFYDKMTFKEIAEAMGTTVGAAKANHHFAVGRLKDMLGGTGDL
jgi:RNA polymerase sigma-70 factor (ECF subfamily)